MRITKFGHACVRLEHDGATLVIDPGMFTQPEAVDGVDAVLITHEHSDHIAPELLQRTDAPVFTIAAVAGQLPTELAERVTVVAPGQEFTAAGLPVATVGEMHAVIHPDYPRFYNSGYVVTLGETRLYHPGDSLTPPPVQVDICCVPASGPWLKAAEAIDFARSVKAPRNLGIHDRVYSEAGLGMLASHMANLLPEDQHYLSLRDGADL